MTKLVQLLYTPYLVFPNVNILHNHGIINLILLVVKLKNIIKTNK